MQPIARTAAEPVAEWTIERPILEAVAAPPDHVGLRRGTIEIDRSGREDVITVRSGSLSLQIVMHEAGPRLELRGVDVAIAASERLALSGHEVSVHAASRLAFSSDGDVETRVRGDRHTIVGGADRLEAGVVELQANDGDVAVRAREDIRLDGEHVHLNGLDTPAPFAWSAPANGIEEESEHDE